MSPLNTPPIMYATHTRRAIAETLKTQFGACCGPEYWHINTAGGELQVETMPRQRYTTVAIDRINAITLDEDADREEWVRTNLWPYAHDTWRPSGRGAYSYIHRVPNEKVAGLLRLWVPKEIEWQTRAAERALGAQPWETVEP